MVIKAYKCTVSEIWRDFFVLAYIACTSYPESMIMVYLPMIVGVQNAQVDFINVHNMEPH